MSSGSVSTTLTKLWSILKIFSRVPAFRLLRLGFFTHRCITSHYPTLSLIRFKEDYSGEFERWFAEKAGEGRLCYITKLPGTNQLGLIMIYKDEEEPIPCVPPLQRKRRLKIAKLKVKYNGMRIGEALISVALNRALKNGYDEIYLTHFTEPESDRLVNLITKLMDSICTDMMTRNILERKRILISKNSVRRIKQHSNQQIPTKMIYYIILHTAIIRK